MKIVWDPGAYKELCNIQGYILHKFGKITQRKYTQEVENITAALVSMPQYGRIDPLFMNRKRFYRSVIISKLSKLVYYVDGEIIHIAAMWDTRKDPNTQVSKVE